MRHVDDLRPFDDADYARVHPSDQRHAGPQGEALILELQRLQRAFEHEHDPEWDSRRARRNDARRADGARARGAQKTAKKAKKGRMGRALDRWLEQFGFIKPAPAPRPPQRRAERPRTQAPIRTREDVVSPPPRRPQPRPVARHDSPPLMDLRPLDLALDPRQPSQVPGQPPQIKPPVEPPLPNPAAAAPATLPAPAQPQTGKLQQLSAKAGTALTTGLTFIASQGTAAHLDDASDLALIPRVAHMYEHELRTGLRVLLVAIVLGGGWMTFVPLAGAVVVPGNLVVQSDVKAIQHPTGGIIAEIKVDNGTRVAAGDLLVRLDATQVKAGMQAFAKQLNEQRGKIARLTAERDDLPQPDFPSELTSHTDDDNVRAVMASENSLFKARLSARQSQKDLLQGRISQLNDEIGGMEAQSASKSKQIELINGELAGVQDLYDKHLVPLTRLTTLQREAARLDGERGQMVSGIAETKSKIGEAQLQIVKTDQDFRSEVVKDLGEAQAKEGELVEKYIASRDQLNRIEIRSPTSGTVHQLAVHTIGGVIKAGETIMEVVPDSDELQVEAHVQPKDIDHVRTGQDAFVRFSAFNQRTTPQLSGQISFVSPDVTTDQKSNSTFYTARIVLSEDERHRLGSAQLIPGMQAEVFLQTGKRTMLSYLLKPLTDQLRRAFVEE